jgi:hypothetical protein
MLLDLCIPLTMKIMALGHPLHEAEFLAVAIVIRCLVVYTLMGYYLPADEPEHLPDLSFAPAGIHTGTRGSTDCDSVHALVDARRRTPAFLPLLTPVPA